jgi:hypothetical protein
MFSGLGLANCCRHKFVLKNYVVYYICFVYVYRAFRNVLRDLQTLITNKNKHRAFRNVLRDLQTFIARKSKDLP